MNQKVSDIYRYMMAQAQHINRSTLLVRVMCLTWLISKLISYQLWLSNRSFPLAPVYTFFAGMPQAFHLILLLISLTGIFVCIIIPHRILVSVILLSEILSCLADQNRWQPWEYFFLFMMAGWWVLKKENLLLSSWKWLLAGLYFFSGLYKIGQGFIHDVWQNLILFRWLHIQPIEPWLLRVGYIPGIVEMIAGIGVLIPACRRMSAWVLILMHLWILLLIGPLGLQLNMVVWPWNLFMIWMIYQLFIQEYARSISFPARQPYAIVILIAWWLLPWLHLAGKWDTYLSSALYQGGVPQLYICPENPRLKKELSAFQVKDIPTVPCSQPASYYRWAMQELNIVPNEEERIYRQAIEALQNNYPGKNRYFMVRHGFRTTVKELTP